MEKKKTKGIICTLIFLLLVLFSPMKSIASDSLQDAMPIIQDNLNKFLNQGGSSNANVEKFLGALKILNIQSFFNKNELYKNIINLGKEQYQKGDKNLSGSLFKYALSQINSGANKGTLIDSFKEIGQFLKGKGDYLSAIEYLSRGVDASILNNDNRRLDDLLKILEPLFAWQETGGEKGSAMPENLFPQMKNFEKFLPLLNNLINYTPCFYSQLLEKQFLDDINNSPGITSNHLSRDNSFFAVTDKKNKSKKKPVKKVTKQVENSEQKASQGQAKQAVPEPKPPVIAIPKNVPFPAQTPNVISIPRLVPISKSSPLPANQIQQVQTTNQGSSTNVKQSVIIIPKNSESQPEKNKTVAIPKLVPVTGNASAQTPKAEGAQGTTTKTATHNPATIVIPKPTAASSPTSGTISIPKTSSPTQEPKTASQAQQPSKTAKQQTNITEKKPESTKIQKTAIKNSIILALSSSREQVLPCSGPPAPGNKAYENLPVKPEWRSHYLGPVPYGRYAPYAGDTGVDIVAPRGYPIYASKPGVVLYSAPSGHCRQRGPGDDQGAMRVRHPDGSDTFYAHLSGRRSSIYAGSRINQGEWMGNIGIANRVPHLHFTIYYTPWNYENSFSTPSKLLNPWPVLVYEKYLPIMSFLENIIYI